MGGWFPRTSQSALTGEPLQPGGIAINHSNQSIVSLSRQSDGVFDIEKWATTDMGDRAYSRFPVIRDAFADTRLRGCTPRVPEWLFTPNFGIF